MLQRAAARLSPSMEQARATRVFFFCVFSSRRAAQVLRLSLASRKHSPRVEMFRTLAPASVAPPGACCWVHLPSGVASTDVSSLSFAPPADASAPVAPSLQPFDHVYPARNGSAPVAVLYAAVGAPCFPPLHAALSAASESGDVRYALRPFVGVAGGCDAPGCAAVRVGSSGEGGPPSSPPPPLPLGGFGVEMALKNTEYKAIDDTKPSEAVPAGGDAPRPHDEEEEADVHGFLFGTLSKRRPELASELETLREALSSSGGGSGSDALSAWQMRDLGLQAAARVASSPDPLKALVELSASFPSMAPSLSRAKVDPAFASEVDATQRSVRGGTTVLTLNGAPMDTERLDVFELIDAIAAEVRFADDLSSLPLPPPARAAVAKLQPPPPSAERLDTRSPPGAAFANDIERDASSARWPRALSSLLTPRFPGRLPNIRRNLFTALFVAHPAGETALATAEAVEYYLRSGVSVRFGLVPLVPPPRAPRAAGADASARGAPLAGAADGGGDGDASPEEAPPSPPDEGVDPVVGLQVARLFAAVVSSHGGPTAWAWLAAASSSRKALDGPPVAPPDPFGGSGTPQPKEPLSWAGACAALASTLRNAPARGSGGGDDDDDDDGHDRASADALIALATSPLDASPASAAIGASLDASWAWADGLGVASDAPLLLLNGQAFPSSAFGPGQPLDYIAVALANQEAQVLAEAVYYGRLTDKDDISEWLARGALPRRNAAISGSASPGAPPPPPPHRLSWPGASVEASLGLRHLASPGREDITAPVTHWLAVGDVASAAGRTLLATVFGAMAAAQPASSLRSCRLAVVDASRTHGPLSALLSAAAALPSRRSKITAFLAALFDDAEVAASSDAGDSTSLLARAAAIADAAGLRGDALVASAASPAPSLERSLASQAAAAHDGSLFGRPGSVTAMAASAAISSGGAALLSNGRLTLLPTPASASSFHPLDLALITDLELRSTATSVASIVAASLSSSQPPDGGGGDTDATDDSGGDIASTSSHAVAAASSLLARRHAVAASRAILSGDVNGLVSSCSLSCVSSGPDDAPIRISGLIDPASTDAQRAAPLLLLLRDALGGGLAIRLALNPARELASLPVAAFYRFASPPLVPRTSSNTSSVAAAAPPMFHSSPPPAARFASLPPQRTLTLGIHVPPPWLVTCAVAPYDLDNLRLEDLGDSRGFTTAFELEHILISGHAREEGAREPPRGAQLLLHPSGEGTVVMSNLGYFQLKASPGLHALSLAPGRSASVFSIAGVADAEPSPGRPSLAAVLEGRLNAGLSEQSDASAAAVALGDFGGRLLRLRLRRRPGMEGEDVLKRTGEGSGADDAAASAGGGGLWGRRARGWLGASPPPPPPGGEVAVPDGGGEDNSKIHIFSVASGHLYERFLKIMVLSVLRHTKTPVKFWCAADAAWLRVVPCIGPDFFLFP